MALRADVFLKLRTPKIMVNDLSTSNIMNWTKHCGNLNDSTFIIFIDPCQNN